MACHASRLGRKMSVPSLFKSSFSKAARLILPVNWPFFLHGCLLIPVFNVGFVAKAVSEWQVISLLTPIFAFPYGPFIAAVLLLCVLMIGVSFAFAFHFFVLNGDSYVASVKKSVWLIRGKRVKTLLYLTASIAAPYVFAALVLLPAGLLVYRFFGAEIVGTLFERAAGADLNAFFTDAEHRFSVLSMVFAALSGAMLTAALSLLNLPIFMMAVDVAFCRASGQRYIRPVRISSEFPKKIRQSHGGYGVVIGLLLAVFVSYQAYGLLNLMFWGSTNTVGRLMVAAHRGDTAKAPENTKAAILKAIETRADCVEVDVVETKDGVLILCHDLNLKRICGIKKDIGTMTYRELKTLDIGSHDDRAFSGERFLTLDEAMTLCDGKIKMNIELKPSKHDHELAEKAVDIFHNHFFYQKGFISSLDEKILTRVETLDPMITTCLDMFVPAKKARLCPVDIYSVKAEYLTDDLFNILEKNGKQCWAWTVNDEQNMTKLIDKGIAGIVTDHSEQALVLAKTRQVRDANFMKRAFIQSLFHIY
ncbi:MAG: glycerophosphoryl diester phosphodiesterase membrane domain-containing protein [Eubacteriaceae bacterium]|nr:glycerophosphoryl diester phosphodiesterase membrane domain-containing protein [Eubacteriaceae bacterium]